MKQRMIMMMTALGLAALLAGGCASNEMVKSEAAPQVTARQEAPKATETINKADTATSVATQKAAETVKVEPAKTTEAPVVAPSAVSSPGFETVYFDFDKSDLRQDARNSLAKNAETMLKAKAGAKVSIEGHCDERGSAEYNLALGERRAKSVQQYLLTLGVQPERLSVVSYGKEKPAVQGNEEAAWAKNRRAEFVVVK